MFEDIVTVQVIQREGGGILLRIGGQRLLEEELRKLFINIQSRTKGENDTLLGDVFAVVREVAVVGQCIEHRTWGPLFFELESSSTFVVESIFLLS